MKDSVRRFLTGLIVVIVIAGACGGFHVAKYRAKKSAVSEAKAVLLDSADEQAETMGVLFESSFRQLEMLADVHAQKPACTDAEMRRMLESLVANSGFAAAFVIGADGIVAHGDNPGLDCSDRDYFQKALAGERAVRAPEDGLAGEYGVVLSVPYYENGAVAGVLCGVVDAESLAQALSSAAYGGAGYSYITDADGNLIIRTASEFFLSDGQNLCAFLEDPKVVFEKGSSLASLQARIVAGEPVAVCFSYGDDVRILTVTPLVSGQLPKGGWLLCNVVAGDVLAERIRAFRRDALETMAIAETFSAVALGIFLFMEHKYRRRRITDSRLREDLLDNLPCGAGLYQIKDGTASLLYLNRRYYELVGRSDERMGTEKVTDAIHPDDLPPLHAELKAAAQEQRDCVYGLRLQTGDGSYQPFRLIGHMMGGKTADRTFCCLYFPIEEGEFAAIRERQETEARYRSLVDHSGGGLTVTEKDDCGVLHNLFTSEGMLRLLHMTRAQHRATSEGGVYAKVCPEDRDIAKAIFDTLQEDGESRSGVYRLMRADGGFTWVSVTARLALENGKKHIYAVHTDVSEQKTSELQAREASEQLGFLNRIAGELLSENEADDAIHNVLSEILAHFGGRRSYVFEFDMEQRIAHNTYEVCAPGVESAKELLSDVPFFEFSAWFSIFERDGYIVIEDASELDETRAGERALLEAQQITSLVAVPLRIGGVLTGMLGVDDPAHNAAQMRRLQAIGDYVSVMLSRRNETAARIENNRRMEVMMGDTPGGFAQMLIHADQSITPCFLNDGFCRMLGMTHDEVSAVYAADAYAGAHPEDRENIRLLLEDAIRRRSTVTTRLRLQHGDGSYVPVEAYYRVWESSSGTFYLNGYYRDISDKIVLEENYKRNLAYRDVTCRNSIGSFHINVSRNAVDDGVSNEPLILALEKEGTLDGFMHRVAAMLADSAAYEAFRTVFSQQKMLEAFTEGRSRIELEHAFRLTPAHEMWIRTIVELFRNPDSGDVEGFIYALGLTEEHMLGLLMRAAVTVGYDYIVSVEVNTQSYRTFLANDGIVTVFQTSGLYDDQMIQSLLTLIHPDDRATAVAEMRLSSLQRALAAKDFYELRYRLIGDGEVRHKKNIYTYLDGSRSHIVICRIDETEAVLDMRAALDAAQKANEAKSEFLSHMSHEIRTPMNAIIGMTRLAEDAAPHNSGETLEYLAQIDAAGQYLLGIINDILDMSRIENGKFELSREWITLSALLAPCLEMMRPLMRQKHITFEMPDMGALTRVARYECYMDPMKVRQMLLNLLNNAWKFTPEGGHIRFSARNLRHDGDTSVDQITVEDDGCGMSEAFLARLFTPFEQETNVYSGSVRGTGLGLAIAQKTAHEMGGNIVAESKLGEGSRFVLTLPYQYREQQAPAEDLEASGKKTLNGAQILLAEDNSINAKIARKLLEKMNAAVTWVQDGKQAVKAFSAAPAGTFDAILMDIRMPEMDGISASRAIRALMRDDAKQIPIIAMSANAFEEDMLRSREAGMDEYLSKPVNPQKLYDTLLAHIGRQK